MARTKVRGLVRPTFKQPRKRLPYPLGLYQTAVGKKWVMGVTGIMLMGFVLVHMIGNLHMYEGPERFNEYGEALRELGGHLIPRTWALWGMRFGLIAAFALHIHSAATLTIMNRQSRPVGYQSARSYSAANFASRSMRATGIIIVLYLFFHLADLTWGWILGDDYIRGDVYNNVSRSLSNVPVAIIYIVANIAVAVHLYHGAWSMFQSLGWNNPKFNQARRAFASTIAGVILIGNLSFPIMNLAGVVSQDDRTTPCHVHKGQETDICLGENN
ncbi:MAG: succinate dehydrogenase cytochrome b subunit [Acidimicrobiales bacterium]